MKPDLNFWWTITRESINLWRELLNIPDEYEVLFIGAGASMQYLMAPVNLLEKGAAYLDNCEESKIAIKQSKGIGRTVTLDSLSDIPTDIDYLHITTTETEGEEEILSGVHTPVTLVADMSTDILSRKVKVKRYGMVYAGREGFSVVIIRKDILGKVSRYIPHLLDYKAYIEDGLMFDTLPPAGMKIMLEDLRKVKAEGGIK